jgi:aryl-alcohol dehydrogenase-like predicted oxidoreductase
VDAGINFIDTANVYGQGRSETITGEAIRKLGLKRDEVVLATKFLGETGPGPNGRGASRFHIMQAVEDSLERLGLDHIDLYQIHGFDPATPMEETLRAMASPSGWVFPVSPACRPITPSQAAIWSVTSRRC